MSSAWTVMLSYQSYPAPEYVNMDLFIFFILKQVQGKIISLDPNANNYVSSSNILPFTSFLTSWLGANWVICIFKMFL